MAWNADATRMPYRMHAEYLRRLFLDNDLASGRFEVEGHAVSPRNLRVPVFAVGTERDHVSPWRSVYKIHTLSGADLTFVLANGGHNAGIVSEPGHAHPHFRLASTPASVPRASAQAWQCVRADARRFLVARLVRLARRAFQPKARRPARFQRSRLGLRRRAGQLCLAIVRRFGWTLSQTIPCYAIAPSHN